MFTYWRNILVHFTLLFGPCILLGYLTDQLLLSVLLGCIGLLLWHYIHLYRMARWLWLKRSISPPRAWGNWDDIFTGIYRLQKNNLRRRHELGKMLKRMRRGIEALTDATILLSEELRVEWCNKLAHNLLGVRLADDQGRRLQDLILNREFEQYLRQAKFELPLHIASPVDDNIMLEVRVMPYGENEYLLIARDVTNLLKLERMRKDFVANVSHELRTPLTVIQGYLELMDDVNALPPEMAKKAQLTMAEQANRMRSLIEQLLSISRLESGLDNIQRVPVDVGYLLTLVQDEANAVNENFHHTLSFDIQSDARVMGVEAELRSAITNLVINAIKYTPEGGKIEVCWKNVRNGVAFSVKDNGEGIAPQHLRRLTERFYRIDKARSRETGGSGLGLSIVKHVLARHQSRLSIRSRVGQGSTFSFVIPKTLVAAPLNDKSA